MTLDLNPLVLDALAAIKALAIRVSALEETLSLPLPAHSLVKSESAGISRRTSIQLFAGTSISSPFVLIISPSSLSMNLRLNSRIISSPLSVCSASTTPALPCRRVHWRQQLPAF